jgi:hypothetical protein
MTKTEDQIFSLTIEMNETFDYSLPLGDPTESDLVKAADEVVNMYNDEFEGKLTWKWTDGARDYIEFVF